MFERTFSFWRRLVSKDAPSEADPSEQERRVWIRFPADIRVNLQLNGKVAPARLSAAVRDISLGGVNLIVDQEVALGEMVRLQLPRSNAGDTYEVLACVVRIDPTPGGNWALGCVFSRELTEEDLRGFGAERVKHDSKDQRIWMRFPVTLRARIQKVASPDTSAQEARILNLSPSGIGMLVKNEMEAGSVLSIDLVNEAGETVKTILACVVHVTGHRTGEFSLGCNFIRQLQEEELKGLAPT